MQAAGVRSAICQGVDQTLSAKSVLHLAAHTGFFLLAARGGTKKPELIYESDPRSYRNA